MWLDGELPERAFPASSGMVLEKVEAYIAHGGGNFRLITACGRSAEELGEAACDWIKPLLDDETVVVMFDVSVNPYEPALVLATPSGYALLSAFQESTRRDGLLVKSADGLQMIDGDGATTEGIEDELPVLLPGSGSGSRGDG